MKLLEILGFFTFILFIVFLLERLNSWGCKNCIKKGGWGCPYCEVNGWDEKKINEYLKNWKWYKSK